MRKVAIVPCLLVLASACTTQTPIPPRPRGDAGPYDAGMRPPRDAGFDAGIDAGPCAPLALCGDVCVDLASDVANCGRCGIECTAPEHAVALCTEGNCDFECYAGFVREGDACVPAPRPLWPPSLSTVRSTRPALRWAMPNDVSDPIVELCADPACATVLATIAAAGSSAVPDSDLPSGPIYWRVTASGRTGPTWRFDVGPAAQTEAAWGIAPDYDRNGYGDVAVGAPFVASSAGRVSVYLGRAGGTTAAASALLRGPDGEGAEYGVAVACAGDLDGDGFADLAVGSQRAAERGRVWIYFGGPSGIVEEGGRHVALDPPADDGSLFGAALAGVGDIDGDGYGDLLVAASGDGLTLGRIHVYRGRAGGVESTPARTVVGVGRFASAVAGAGDLNADGYADVVIGATNASEMRGALHVFLGGPDGIGAEPSMTITGSAASGQLGYAVTGAGDLNGDGYADLAAGAPYANGAVGAVLVFYGGPDGPSTTADLTITGSNSGGSYFGSAVAGIGDATRDGFDDLAVGAFGVNGRAGRVIVFLGSASGLVTATRKSIEGPFGSGGDFGRAVASAGDVDGNGHADLIVGAPGVDDRTGRAYIFRGRADGISTTALVDLLGTSTGGAFGRAVASAAR